MTRIEGCLGEGELVGAVERFAERAAVCSSGGETGETPGLECQG